MKAQTPPSDCASAMMWLTSVVFPEDSGPKISTMRPRGTPPMPSARSSASDPVGIASTLTVPLSPSRIREPSPNSFLIPLTAFSSAASFAFASLAETSFKVVFLSANSITSLLPHPAATPRLGHAPGDFPRRTRDDRGPPRSPSLGTNPSDGHMWPERPLLGLVEALRLEALRHARLQRLRPRRQRRQGVQPRPAPRRPRLRIEQLDPGSGSDPLPHHRGDRLDLLLRPVAEEGERDVQGLRSDGPQRRIHQRLPPPGDDLLAEVVGQVESDEQPRPRAFRSFLRHGRHAKGRGRMKQRSKAKFRLLLRAFSLT